MDDNTVTVNISRLKNKLDTDAISNVRGLGYLWREQVIKKIVKYLMIWFLFAVVWTLGLGIFAVYTETAERKQIAKLIQEYPEQEGEIIALFQNSYQRNSDKESAEISAIRKRMEEKYGYHLVKSAWTSSVGILWGCVMLCFTAGIFAAAYRENKRSRQLLASNDELYMLLIDELEAFKRGEFHLTQDFEQRFGEQELSDRYMQVRGLLAELGNYFSDLKERLSEEENNTKALITDISHQLKTPLASLHMNHELAMNEGLTMEERKEFEEQEILEIEKLETLLDELMKLSRLEKKYGFTQAGKAGNQGDDSGCSQPGIRKGKGKANRNRCRYSCKFLYSA